MGVGNHERDNGEIINFSSSLILSIGFIIFSTGGLTFDQIVDARDRWRRVYKWLLLKLRYYFI